MSIVPDMVLIGVMLSSVLGAADVANLGIRVIKELVQFLGDCEGYCTRLSDGG
jgi:hypothetical protein